MVHKGKRGSQQHTLSQHSNTCNDNRKSQQESSLESSVLSRNLTHSNDRQAPSRWHFAWIYVDIPRMCFSTHEVYLLAAGNDVAQTLGLFQGRQHVIFASCEDENGQRDLSKQWFHPVAPCL